MDSGRAARELGWVPTVGALDVLAELVGGMADVAGDDGSPVLRTRSVPELVREAVRNGPVGRRHLP
jgi:hypothetical protein